MLRMSVSESVRTGNLSTGLFQTLSIGNIGQFGAPGRNGGTTTAPAGEARLSVSSSARHSAKVVPRERPDEHTAFIAAIIAQPGSGAQPTCRTMSGRTIGRCLRGPAVPSHWNAARPSRVRGLSNRVSCQQEARLSLNKTVQPPRFRGAWREPERSGTVAAVLSLLPGLGHAYLGRRRTALLFALPVLVLGLALVIYVVASGGITRAGLKLFDPTVAAVAALMSALVA